MYDSTNYNRFEASPDGKELPPIATSDTFNLRRARYDADKDYFP